MYEYEPQSPHTAVLLWGHYTNGVVRFVNTGVDPQTDNLSVLYYVFLANPKITFRSSTIIYSLKTAAPIPVSFQI